jgi:D-alanyl-D-alanine dipeptidase
MGELGIDALIVGPSPDLTYLTGFAGRQSERLLVFVLPRRGAPRLLVPSFEAPRLAAVLPLADTTSWDDGEEPLPLLRGLLPRRVGARIGVGAQLFASTILGLRGMLDEPQLVDATTVLGGLRLRKSDNELELLRGAAAAADATLDDLYAEPIAGRAESELATFIGRRLLENGHDEVGHALVAGGANAAVPHHHASREVVASGAALFDIGGVLGGYRSDVTRTVCVGGPPGDELRSVHACVREANEAALATVRPGATAAEIDAAARQVIEKAGYGAYFTHRTGHGIGLDVHEPPYLVAGDTTVLAPGMVFSIEPGVYLPGQFGVRVEDIVTVTRDGAERLNRSSPDLVTLC